MEIIKINPNEIKTAYWFINLKGKIYFKINNKSGSNRLKAWWVKGPFGTVENIPDLILKGQTPYLGIGWGKLKVSGADSETIMFVTESAQVASNFPSVQF